MKTIDLLSQTILEMASLLKEKEAMIVALNEEIEALKIQCDDQFSLMLKLSDGVKTLEKEKEDLQKQLYDDMVDEYETMIEDLRRKNLELQDQVESFIFDSRRSA